MRVLVACEMSGRVRDAFTTRGHYALSCDLRPSLTDGPHYQGDVLDMISDRWDMMIAFPPCTDLSAVCAKDWPAKQADGRQQAALNFVQALMDADIPRICVENPVGRISSAIRKPDQIIQPWCFGDPWIKRTCLWLTGLPKLTPDMTVKPRGHWVDGGTRVWNKTAEYGGEKFGSNREAERKAERSKTFPGIARAMAEQWG